MAIIGIGVDIVKNNRLKKLIKSKKFVERVFTSNEKNNSLRIKNKLNFFSKRFAAKEAFSKALGTGFRMKLNFKDIEVVNDKMGKPNYVKNKKITKLIRNKFKIKSYNCFLSISDEKKYSTAFAIIQS